MVGQLRAAHYHRFEIPLISSPVEFPQRDVPMDPYALGLLLGDGCLTTATTPSFSTADPELARALQATLPATDVFRKAELDYVLRRKGGGRGGVIVANPVTAVLRDLKLAGTRSGTKFVPELYLYNSSNVRHAMLQGLLDTDGGPVTQDARTCRIQYCTTSPRLREDVLFLVRSLGGIAYWRTRAVAGRAPGQANGRPVYYRADAYVIDIRLPRELAPFRLARKRDLYEPTGGGRPMRFIESIEPAGEEETVCIRVAAEDSLYVTDDFLVTHNSLNEAFIILDEAQNTTAPQMKMFLTRLGFGSQAVVTGDVTQIDLAGEKSGLVLAREILHDVEGIAMVDFNDRDVIRHELVARIVRAYDRFEKGNAPK
jgi:phosphate starvation-inducible PhoH-like protein